MSKLNLLALALASCASAQSSVYSDPNTGISFSRRVETKGFSFGVAAAESTTASDFIGQIVSSEILSEVILR
jgi:hypothetical protein